MKILNHCDAALMYNQVNVIPTLSIIGGRALNHKDTNLYGM